jgi:hypothetical protein
MIRYLYKALTEQAMVELMGIVEEEVAHALSQRGTGVHHNGAIRGGGRADQAGAHDGGDRGSGR